MNSYAQINLDGSKAVSLWNRIDNIGRNEKVEMIQEENGQKVIHIGNISCVFEMYNGCSMFVISPKERKMIVALDGTADFMNQLAYAGIYVDEENARMDIKAIDCFNDGKDTICKIEEEEN
jgi:hypothetical protein